MPSNSDHLVRFVGGPAAGCMLPARCPDGVVLSHKAAGQVALYDVRDGRAFFREIRDRDAAKAFEAAVSEDWDVLAWSESMGGWPA